MKIIVVCAHLMDSRGYLSIESKGRCGIASKIYRKKKCDKIIVPGWDYRDDTHVAISSRMKLCLVDEYNLCPSVVDEEARSRDTVGDAIFCRLSLDKFIKQLTHVYVVTSNYHVERALKIFRFVFGTGISIISSGSFYVGAESSLESHERDSLEAFHKTFSQVAPADIGALVEVLTTNHPFYNGDKYPKIKLEDPLSRDL